MSRMKRRKTEKTTPKRVLVSITIGGASGADCFSGILQRANASHLWTIGFELDWQRANDALRARPQYYDGVITEMPETPEALKHFFESDVPTVFLKNILGIVKPSRTSSFLRLDEEEIGREAVRHFSSMGSFGSWVFAYGRTNADYTTRRHAGFKEAVAQQTGAVPLALHVTAQEKWAQLQEELERLPRPVAIFADCDSTAVNALALCRRAGLAIPEQASVLGVDDDKALCLNSRPTLSSIKPDHGALGEKAVEELARLMDGGEGRVIVLENTVREVVRRESTRFLPPAEHLVRRAMAFIDERAAEALTVADVAAHLRVSRPLLDLRFRQIRGESVGRAIAAARLEEVKRRLSNQRESATQIASHCGFASVSTLSRFFRRETGMALSTWRAAAHIGPASRKGEILFNNPLDSRS